MENEKYVVTWAVGHLIQLKNLEKENILQILPKVEEGMELKIDRLFLKDDRKFIKLEKNKYISTELGRQFIHVVPEELKTHDLTINFENE